MKKSDLRIKPFSTSVTVEEASGVVEKATSIKGGVGGATIVGGEERKKKINKTKGDEEERKEEEEGRDLFL